jgi:preprotein translocase subunit SecE
MENNLQRYVWISFLAVSGLIAYIAFVALFKLAGMYDVEAKVKGIDLWIRLASLGLGLGLFIGLYRSDTANQFMHETVTELTRVTWPTNKETMNATFIVVIMVLVTGMILGLFDKFWTLVIQWIL